MVIIMIQINNLIENEDKNKQKNINKCWINKINKKKSLNKKCKVVQKRQNMKILKKFKRKIIKITF